MQISQVLAGYSLGRADLLRRAMGKKKAEEMAKERVGFLEGCVENGVDEAVAGAIFDMMEKFAAYGFNKSHSAAYGLLTVQTAWLKAHYPVEFMAALLTSEAANTDKVVAAHRRGPAGRHRGALTLRERVGGELHGASAEGGAQGRRRADPSSAATAPAEPCRAAGGARRIRFGLGAVKGVGDSAVEAMLAAREEGGPFKSLFDFCCRVDPRRMNKKVIEALVKSGAFDFEGVPRWKLCAGIDAALVGRRRRPTPTGRAARRASSARCPPSRPGPATPSRATGSATSRWRSGRSGCGSPSRRRRSASTSPATRWPATRRRRAATPPPTAPRCSRSARATRSRWWAWSATCGSGRTRRRAPASASSRSRTCPARSRSSAGEGGPAQGNRPAQRGWSDWEMLVKSDEPLLVHGEVRLNQRDEEHPSAEIVASDIELLSHVRNQKTSEVLLRIDADRLAADTVSQLRALLGRHGGPARCSVRAVIPERSETTASGEGEGRPLRRVHRGGAPARLRGGAAVGRRT